jgi:inhibitor of cysteine peptidase
MHTLSSRSLTALVLLLLIIGLAGCQDRADAGSTVELTAADSGRTITLAPGDRLSITLGSNASTGFRWVLTTEPDPAVVALSGSRYVAPETELVGAGRTEIWTFQATGEGTTTIELRYERSSGETAEEPFTLTTKVGG